MTADARLTKVEGDLELISREVRRAISLAAMYSRCPECHDIIDMISDSAEGWGFLTIRDALHRDLIVTLMGVVERGQDRTACLGGRADCWRPPRLRRSPRRNDAQVSPDASRQGDRACRARPGEAWGEARGRATNPPQGHRDRREDRQGASRR